MSVNPETLIIIPAYNEAGNIARVIAATRASAPLADILVVNDGSSDDTAAIARQARARVISLLFNIGYGVALQTGYKYALAKGYRYVIQMDGDGQHEPACIPTLLAEVQSGAADVVVGSRFLGRETGSYRVEWGRRLGMTLFGGIASFIMGQKITDPTSGFQALNREALRFFASDAYPGDFPDADVLIMLHYNGFRVKEVPVIMYCNTDGKSMHSGLKPLYYVFKMCLSIFVTLLRGNKVKGYGDPV